MILTGIIFGLGLSELVLVLVAIVLIAGPKRIKTIKPFLKVVYKNYLGFMREVNEMQGEVTEMKETIMEPIKEVEREAQEELRSVEAEASEGLEGAREIKKGLKKLVEQSKKEMNEARQQARLEEKKGRGPAARQQMGAAHVSRGAHVGLLGRQAPGSSRRMQFGQKPARQLIPPAAKQPPKESSKAEVSLASGLEPKDKQRLFSTKSQPVESGKKRKKGRKSKPGDKGV